MNLLKKNVNWERRRDISNTLGYPSTKGLGKYLGKAKNLSMAGRLPLAKSVIQVMPTYVMQASGIPKSVCDEIDNNLLRRVQWLLQPVQILEA